MDDETSSMNFSVNLAEKLGYEDLAPYSVDELKSRKMLLEQEILRTEARIAFAKDHKSAANSLFK